MIRPSEWKTGLRPRWWHWAWMRLHRDRSLRWQALQHGNLLARSRKRSEHHVRDIVRDRTSTAWVVPPLLIGLAIGASAWPRGRSVTGWTPAIATDAATAGAFLIATWQVLAAVLAILVVVVFFALESAARERPEIGLISLARRTLLVHAILVPLGSVLALGVIIGWRADGPEPTGTVAGLLLGALGLMAVVAVVPRALRVADPSFLREIRERDLTFSTESTIDQRVLASLGTLMLTQRLGRPVRDASVMVGGPANSHMTDTGGLVYDIDLTNAATWFSQDVEDVYLEAELDGEVEAGSRLVTWSGGARRPVDFVRIVPERPPVEDPLRDLKEEGLRAVRSGSIALVQEVMDSYLLYWTTETELLATVPQDFEAMFDDGVLLPASRLEQSFRDMNSFMEAAAQFGHREIALKLFSVTFAAGRLAIDHRSTKLLQRVLIWHRQCTGLRPSDEQLRRILLERCWRNPTDLFRYPIASNLQQPPPSQTPADRDALLTMSKQVFINLAETMRLFLVEGNWKEFEAADHHFQLLLGHWHETSGEMLARRVRRDPSDHSAAEVQQADAVLTTTKPRRELSQLRNGLRLCLLALMTKHALAETETALWQPVIDYARTMPKDDALVGATGYTLGIDSPLGHWVFDAPEGVAAGVDRETPTLSALALSLVLGKTMRARRTRAEWLYPDRIERFEGALDRILALDPVRRVLTDVGSTRTTGAVDQGDEEVRGDEPQPRAGDIIESRRSNATRALTELALAEEARRQDAVISADFDDEKVAELTTGIQQAYQENRVLDSLLALVGHGPPEATGGAAAFGVRTLIPKDLLITPSDVVGRGMFSDEYGRVIAQGEITRLAERAHDVGHGYVPAPSESLPSRLTTAIEDLRNAGYEPVLIFVPHTPDLRGPLGLPDYRPENVEEEGPISYHIAGHFSGCWVIEWWDLPEDRIVVIDLKRFCDIAEGKDADGAPTPPHVDVTTIDDQRAEAIVAGWEPEQTEEAEAERLHELLTQVELSALRSYLVEVRDPAAARVVMLAVDKPDSDADTHTESR